MKCNIRKAGPEDIPAIHDLVRELAVYEKAGHEFVATREEYRQDMADGIFQALVAEKDGLVVGMTLYYMAYSTWKGKMLFLEDFVVKPDARREGIGQQLFDALLLEAEALGCKLVKWQVLDWNKPAIAFYEKNQAVIDKEWWNGTLFLQRRKN